MRTLYWYAYFCISLIFRTPALLRLLRQKKTLSPADYAEQVNRTAADWTRGQLRNSGGTFTVTGSEYIPDGPVLFVSNHQGNFDIAIFIALIGKNKGYVSKSEMLRIPLLRTWMRELQCVFMDRSSPRDSMRAISQGVNILKSGYSLVIFPEGTRSRGGRVGEFKSGSFRLATKARVPVVPVTIDGSWRLMEANGNRIRPADVRVTIHPPVPTKGLSKEEDTALPEQVRQTIVSALEPTTP